MGCNAVLNTYCGNSLLLSLCVGYFVDYPVSHSSENAGSIFHLSSRRPVAVSALWFQTEVLEGKRHEHSVTSKINLVDLAGSERQSLAKTSGDRLRVRLREANVHSMYIPV